MKRFTKGIKLFLIDAKSAAAATFVFVSYSVIANVFFERYCPSVLVTGLPCPACGMTRATVLLFRGNFIEALVMHPMVLGYIFLALGFFLFRYILFIDTAFLKNVLVFVLVSTVVVYIYRMITVFPMQSPMVYYDNNLLRRLIGVMR